MRWYVPSMLPSPLYGRSPGEAARCCSLDSGLNKMPQTPSVGAVKGGNHKI